MTMPVPALTNGLQGILRDENDDMRVWLERWFWVGFALLCSLHHIIAYAALADPCLNEQHDTYLDLCTTECSHAQFSYEWV